MVKVLENRVVDLDVMPGTKEAQERAKYVSAYYEAAQRLGREKIEENGSGDALKIPDESPSELSAAGNASASAQSVAGALGGTVKGVVDTTGNTVGALGEGLFGTVTGLGKGLGSAGMYAGGAVGRGFGLSQPQKGKEIEGVEGREAGQGKQGKADKVEEVDEGERRQSQVGDSIKELEEFEKQKGIRMEG